MYKIGEMVVVLPTEERSAYVGEIDGVQKRTVFDTEEGVIRELRYLINFYEFTEAELASTGEHLTIDGEETTLTNIGLVDGEYQLTFDNEFTINAERLYCDEDGLHIYNGEPETEEESDDDEFNLGFMLGYLEAVEDSDAYMGSNDSLWDKVLVSIDGVGTVHRLLSHHRDKLTEFYNRAIELKNQSVADTEQTDVKPELTLDEIKEKLGYDFNLVD